MLPSPNHASLPPRAVYAQHFGFSGDPFSLAPDPTFFYQSPIHAEAIATLKIALTERRGLALMTGEVGTGKTTILYSLLGDLPPNIHTAYVSNTKLPFDALLHLALTDFGVTPDGPGRYELLTALNRYLTRCADVGATAALIVDEAQNLDVESFEQMRLLSNFETLTEKLLQIVLVGQTELEDKLQRPELRQIADRVAAHCRVTPLDRAVSRAYIDDRVQRAGGSPHLFTPRATELITRAAGGIPRRLNILCHNALLFAYGHGASHVSRTLARAAVRHPLPTSTKWSAVSSVGNAAMQPGGYRRITASVAAGIILGMAGTAGVLRSLDWPNLPAPAAPMAQADTHQESPAADVVPADDSSGHEVLDDEPVHGSGTTLGAAPAHDDGAPPAAAGGAAPVSGGEIDTGAMAVASADTVVVDGGDPQRPPVPVVAPPATESLVHIPRGATLESLARAYYGSATPELIDRIRSANPQVRNPDHILAGDLLRLPAPVQAAADDVGDSSP